MFRAINFFMYSTNVQLSANFNVSHTNTLNPLLFLQTLIQWCKNLSPAFIRRYKGGLWGNYVTLRGLCNFTSVSLRHRFYKNRLTLLQKLCNLYLGVMWFVLYLCFLCRKFYCNKSTHINYNVCHYRIINEWFIWSTALIIIKFTQYFINSITLGFHENSAEYINQNEVCERFETDGDGDDILIKCYLTNFFTRNIHTLITSEGGWNNEVVVFIPLYVTTWHVTYAKWEFKFIHFFCVHQGVAAQWLKCKFLELSRVLPQWLRDTECPRRLTSASVIVRNPSVFTYSSLIILAMQITSLRNPSKIELFSFLT